LLSLHAPCRACADWQLAWSDEFDLPGLPDPARWDYEEGFIRNREKQYYTRARPENVRVEGGYLVIEARKEPFRNRAYREGSRDWRRREKEAAYTSGCVITRHKADWTYGRIEVRARLPHGQGIWPAIWTLGSNRGEVGWPRCGEIDIMEFVGHEPGRIHGNVHFARDGEHASHPGVLETEAPYAAFHTYALEWDEERMVFFFDDEAYHTFTLDAAGEGKDNPFRKPQYLLINLALGGSWGGTIDDTVLPQTFLVDYVRVYRPAR
jgi:beta-glucanase (GH16 family)